MRAYIGWVVVLVGLVAAAVDPGRVSADSVQVHVDAVDTGGLPTVTATVTVTDSAGLPLADLPAGAFSATVDGAPVPLAGVAGAADQDLGIAVALTFDTSGSMLGPPMEQARSAGRALVSQLGPADQAAVIAFSNEVRVVQPFTGDRQALAAAIDGLVASGNTALYEAVARSYDLVLQTRAPRKAIVLLSDGQDFGAVSQTDRATSLAAAGRPGVATFIVGLGELVDLPYLDELRAASRGRLMLAPDPAALQGLYQAIGALLRQQYVLTLDLADIEGGPQSILRVQVATAAGAAAAEVPINLPAPEPPPQPVTPAPTPVVTPAPETPPVEEPVAETEAEGGAAAWVIAAIAGGAVVAVGGGTLIVVRRHRRREPSEEEAAEESLERIAPAEPPNGEDAFLFPAAHPPDATAPESWLVLHSAGGDRRFPLGPRPVTIGFSADCDIQLPDGDSMRMERARVWSRDGRYMLHSLSRVGRVFVGGAPAAWVVLEHGDEIQIGSHTLRFESPGEAG